ncbi:MAG: Fic family protein [Roseomonas sp.]|nr:Fic family protein [Roseomonas sp.]
MLGLSDAEIKNLGLHVFQGQIYRHNGAALLRNAMNEADRERTIERRAALLALLIQANQVFNDGNTRTATAAMYALVVVERGQFIRAKAYQAYGMVGYYGPRYSNRPDLSLEVMAAWIKAKLYGPRDIVATLNNTLDDIRNVNMIVGAITAAAKTSDNRSDPLVRNLLQQKKSWHAHHGYD